MATGDYSRLLSSNDNASRLFLPLDSDGTRADFINAYC